MIAEKTGINADAITARIAGSSAKAALVVHEKPKIDTQTLGPDVKSAPAQPVFERIPAMLPFPFETLPKVVRNYVLYAANATGSDPAVIVAIGRRGRYAPIWTIARGLTTITS